MSKEIEAVIDANEIETKNVEVGEWGLTFKGQLTTDEWLDVALNIQKFDGKIQWYLGDLAVYAESPTTGWGESKYAKLLEGTGYEYQTLRHYASISRRFDRDFRERVHMNAQNNTVSFGHFQIVAPLDDNFAAYWLEKAGNNGWGVAKLREEIRKWKESRGEIAEREEKPIGFVSFGNQMKEFFKGFVPQLTHEEYDEQTWLLEVHDTIEERLHDLGIEL